MEELAKLPKDMVFFTQITMEAGEDGDYLDAMRKANIKGASWALRRSRPRDSRRSSRTGIIPAKLWQSSCKTFKQHGVHVLGSFIFGLAH